MGIFDAIRTQFIEVIEWLDDSGNTMLYRFPVHDQEIKNGARLDGARIAGSGLRLSGTDCRRVSSRLVHHRWRQHAGTDEAGRLEIRFHLSVQSRSLFC